MSEDYLNALKESTGKVSRLVVKIGTNIMTHDSGRLNLRLLERLACTLCDLSNRGIDIVLVSSGAVAAGASKLGFDGHPKKTREKQACAAAGQSELMVMYDRFFSTYGKKTAQILLTRDVVDNPVRRKNAIATFSTLFGFSCIPIVNENDTVSSDEIKFSGNDILSAHVAILCGAGLLVNLTDRDGFYDKDPATHSDARLIPYVAEVNDEVYAYAGGAGSVRGTGGMAAKLDAVRIVAEYDIPVIIANGRDPHILYDIFDGNFTGTYFGSLNSPI